MHKTILVPVDVNQIEKADVMLATARKLGGEGAKIILAHIIEKVPAYVAAQIPEAISDAATQEAHDALSRLATAAGGAAEIDIRAGHAAQEILAIAEEKGVDTIIIASHRPGLQDYFLGSTAARVVRHSKCTVVVIR
jgi:universal stress protein F